MRRLLLVLTLIALVLIMLFGGASWYIASQAVKAERKPLEDTVARLQIPFEEVTFPARDKTVMLKGWYLLTSDRDSVIILVHGVDSNRASRDTGLVDLAGGLYREGFSVLLFDLRGHGESGEGRLSGGLFEQEDVLGAYDWLLSRGFQPGRIGLWGISLGAAVSLLAAAREPGIAGVVADSAFADIRDMIASEIPKRTSMPSWVARALIPGVVLAARLFYGIDLNLIVPQAVVDDLDYPAYLIHCEGDQRIPPEHSRRLQEASPASVLWIPSCGEHARAFKTFPQEYLRRVSDYFQQRLSGGVNVPRAMAGLSVARQSRMPLATASSYPRALAARRAHKVLRSISVTESV